MDSFIKEYSCRSQEACTHMERTHVGTHSCGIGSDSHQACSYTKDSTIGDYSCQTEFACYGMKRTYVGRNSCGIGKKNTYACLAWDSTIGDNSCQKEESCYAWLRQFTGYGENLKIGNNACNMKRICYKCEDNSVVPDDACNGDLEDTYINTKGDTSCNYCSVSSTKICWLSTFFSFSTHNTLTQHSALHTFPTYTVRLPQHYIDCTVYCLEYKRWPSFERRRSQ